MPGGDQRQIRMKELRVAKDEEYEKNLRQAQKLVDENISPDNLNVQENEVAHFAPT